MSKKNVYILLPLILFTGAILLYILSSQKLSLTQTSTNTKAAEACDEDIEYRCGRSCCPKPTPTAKVVAAGGGIPTPTPFGYCPSYLPTDEELKKAGIPFQEYTKTKDIDGTNGRVYIEQTSSNSTNCIGATSVRIKYSDSVLAESSRLEKYDDRGYYIYRKIYVYTNPYHLAILGKSETYLYTNTFRREACDIANYIKHEKNPKVTIWFQKIEGGMKEGMPDKPCNEQKTINDPDAYQFTPEELYDSSETGKYYSHYKPPKN